MTQTIREAWIAEGEAKGRAQGQAEGELRLARKLLRQVLEKRFGSLPETIGRRIDDSTDLDRLQAAVVEAPGLESLDQLPL